MNKDEFSKLLTLININLTDNEYHLLEEYSSFLQEYNAHTNLTAIKDEKDIYLKHFYDSLTLTKIIDIKEINTILDIGTGAGFPGVVLKIFYPHIHLTLLDSNNKKTKFLEELVNKLNLDNVTIINDRAENYVKERINSFDLVTARAVANLRVLSEISLPFVKKEGYFIAMKGNVEEELKEAESTIKKMNSKITEQTSFELPNELGTRSLIKITKEKETNINSLRPYNKILKSPLI
jgi:16S rRNA (guanine527-N7)-methyltransferase